MDSLKDAIRRARAQGNSQFQLNAAGGSSQGLFNANSSQNTASVVYVIDDSGSMDGDYPEVRAALRAVRDTNAPNVKTALITFGQNHYTRFGLTNHATAPWNKHINTLGGFLGGTIYDPPMEAAKDMLIADSASVKKIVFMSDGQSSYETSVINQIKSAGIIIDTVAFGTEVTETGALLYNFTELKKIATDAGGSYRLVRAAASSGTTNSPKVTPRDYGSIFTQWVKADNTTLYLIDSSFSMTTPRWFWLYSAIGLVEVADMVYCENIRTSRTALARFIGRSEASSVTPYYLVTDFEAGWDHLGSGFLPYDQRKIFAPLAGSSGIDQALKSAYTEISDQPGATRQVVLITDGITPSPATASTIKLYTDANILIHTVATGTRADRVYLKKLATAAGGTFSVGKRYFYQPPETCTEYDERKSSRQG